MSSTLTAYVPIIVALLAALAGMVTYTFQKRADRKAQLIEIRRAAYRAYLADLMNVLNLGPNEEARNNLLKSEIDLFVVASDETIEKVSRFTGYMRETVSGSRDVALAKKYMADLTLSMRADCFERSSLSTDKILPMLPFQD